MDDAWAQLVSTTENESDPVEINKNTFTIGRSKDVDLSFIGNKLMSGKHCFIERDERSGEVYLHDTSTNGTLLNLTTKLVGKRHRLQHGDEIHVVYRKADPSHNVAYMFQDLDVLRQEELEDSSRLEDSSDNTQQYSITDELETTAENSDIICHEDEVDSSTKRKSEENESAGPVPKKPKTDEEEEEEEEQGTSDVQGKEAAVSLGDSNPTDTGGSTDPQTEQAVCIKKTQEVSADSKPPKSDIMEDEVDAFEESLICIICQEILHDCISCQPCMHSFCAGCYSDWMTRSHECPSCRGKVERVNKNYVINNLVDAYLKQHEDKRRPEEELKMLDARSKIMKDTVKPPKLKKTLSERIDDDDEGLSDSDLEGSSQSHSDSDDGGIAPAPFVTTTPFGFGATNIYFPPRPPPTVCRQCPGYRGPHPVTVPGSTVSAIASKVISTVIGLAKGATGTAGDSTDAGSSTDGAAIKNLPFQCPPNQVHILCQCCLQPMPDRRKDSYTNKAVPTQQCTLCYRLFCHQYWGCKNAACAGCMFRFRDMKFQPNSFTNLILDNNYESDIFKNYVEGRGETLADVFDQCLAKLDAREYTCMDQARGLTSDSILCYGCGMRNFKDLAYQYRKDIPDTDLPAAVTRRPDCYWGKNCRTQKGKLHHAARFNHICEQTKT